MKTQIIQVEQLDGSIIDHIMIENGDGSFTSMTKAYYDEQQEHLQTIVPQIDEASAE